MRLVGICGSLRAGSLNRALLREAARRWGGDFAEAPIRMPLYDGDAEDEHGVPPEAQALADLIGDADAVAIASPEYNKSIPGVLKNALDWVSRTKGRPFRDRPVAIMSASDGPGGGERGQFALRLALNSFRARVLAGPEVILRSAQHHLADGKLTDERAAKALDELMADLRAAATPRG